MIGPLQVLPVERIVADVIRQNSAHGFIYLNNPKVGCSTVKSCLWQGITGQAVKGASVHRVAGSPFTNVLTDPVQARNAYIFTFLRNPFQRIASAYLDKISGKANLALADLAGHDMPGGGISFDTFVEIIATRPAERLDPHWRPQYLNTLYPFIQPNLMCDLESMDQVLPTLLAQLFPGQPVAIPTRAARSHATTARQNWRSMLADPATQARVIQLYGGDFDAFGYRPDIHADPAAAQPVRRNDHAHPGLAQVVRYWAAPAADKAKSLRKVELADQHGALADWILAHRLRMNAPNRQRVAEMTHDHRQQIAHSSTFLRDIVIEVEAWTGPKQPVSAANAPKK